VGPSGRALTSPAPFPNHLALTVRLDGAEWFVDAGLGDALHEPIRLTHGPVEQGPFGYRMERIDGGWRFYHDPVGAFTAMDFDDAEAPAGAFDHGHTVMSTSPESNFVTNITVARRDAAGLDKLVNQTIRRTEGPHTVEGRLSSPAEFFATLSDRFGLGLDDLDGDDRALLWRDAQAGQAAHEASLVAQLEGGHVPG
jgi:N-hydroxyarylamine O-acetyltransferase